MALPQGPNAEQFEQMMKAQVAAMVTLELEKKGGAIDLSRKMLIDQQKLKYKSPADKRAVAFMLDIQFDVEDHHEAFKKLLDAEGNLKDITANKAAVEEFLKLVPTFGNKMHRKISRELEAYNLANSSRFGWATEKYFRQEEVFSNSRGLTDEKKKWFELDDLSQEEKVKKMHRAERQASLSLKHRKQGSSKFDGLQRGKKRTRWGPVSESATSSSGASSSAANSSGGFVPAQLHHPPYSGPLCFNCWKPGHLRRNCTNPTVKKEN